MIKCRRVWQLERYLWRWKETNVRKGERDACMYSKRKKSCPKLARTWKKS